MKKSNDMTTLEESNAQGPTLWRGSAHGDALSFYTAQSQPPSHPMSFSRDLTALSR